MNPQGERTLAGLLLALVVGLVGLSYGLSDAAPFRTAAAAALILPGASLAAGALVGFVAAESWPLPGLVAAWGWIVTGAMAIAAGRAGRDLVPLLAIAATVAGAWLGARRRRRRPALAVPPAVSRADRRSRAPRSRRW